MYGNASQHVYVASKFDVTVSNIYTVFYVCFKGKCQN